ncbi:MAG TPA: PqqD family protein [Thermoanaerobaculia bacterium]|nr:PqqD family protein [Thermoanaerobaculia bacterium]
MNEIGGGSVLRRRADVRFRVIDEEGVVVRQSAGEVLVLNDLGTRILAMADGLTPVGSWIDCLLGEFEVERAQLEHDVLAFAVELVEQGLLEPLAAAAERPAPAGAPGAAGGGR